MPMLPDGTRLRGAYERRLAPMLAAPKPLGRKLNQIRRDHATTRQRYAAERAPVYRARLKAKLRALEQEARECVGPARSQ